VLVNAVDRFRDVRPPRPEGDRRSRVAEHLRERGPPGARAEHRCLHLSAASDSIDCLAGSNATAGGSSPRRDATRAVTSAMIALVAARSAFAEVCLPAHSDRSTGLPATVATVCRGHSLAFLLPYGR